MGLVGWIRFNLHLGCFSLHSGCFSLHSGCFDLHLGCFSLHLGCFSLHLHSYRLHLHSYRFRWLFSAIDILDRIIHHLRLMLRFEVNPSKCFLGGRVSFNSYDVISSKIVQGLYLFVLSHQMISFSNFLLLSAVVQIFLLLLSILLMNCLNQAKIFRNYETAHS